MKKRIASTGLLVIPALFGIMPVGPTAEVLAHPTFCGQDFLDIQIHVFYNSTMNKECLIK